MSNFELTGLQEALKAVTTNLEKTFNEKLPEQVETYLNDQLQSQKDAEGNSFPSKTVATIKQYQKKGYNTTKYLVRTGSSTQLTSKQSGNKLVIQPVGWDVLKYPIEKSNIAWPVLSNQEIKDIEALFQKELSKILK